jgi:hypothetical protein
METSRPTWCSTSSRKINGAGRGEYIDHHRPFLLGRRSLPGRACTSEEHPRLTRGQEAARTRGCSRVANVSGPLHAEGRVESPAYDGHKSWRGRPLVKPSRLRPLHRALPMRVSSSSGDHQPWHISPGAVELHTGESAPGARTTKCFDSAPVALLQTIRHPLVGGKGLDKN